MAVKEQYTPAWPVAEKEQSTACMAGGSESLGHCYRSSGRRSALTLRKTSQLPGDLSDVCRYRHWTFSDDQVEGTAPAYMMARRLHKRAPEDPYPSNVMNLAASISPMCRLKVSKLVPKLKPRKGDLISGKKKKVLALRPENDTTTLFNKVVELIGDRDGIEFYYVLTYLPDLQWCHLSPMRRNGQFGAEKGSHVGRTRWMLVPEGKGKELDVSAARCVVRRAMEMRKTANADKEEWDILDKTDEDIQRNDHADFDNSVPIGEFSSWPPRAQTVVDEVAAALGAITDRNHLAGADNPNTPATLKRSIDDNPR